MSQTATAGAGDRRTRILVVDDVEPVRTMLAKLLQQEGYEVDLAANADEALLLALEARWDGVVLDVNLPGMNGVELYARLLRLHGNQRLPAIFFTGRPNEALRLGLNEALWIRLVQKPCGIRQFMDALQQCLQLAGKTTPDDRPPPAPMTGDLNGFGG